MTTCRTCLLSSFSTDDTMNLICYAYPDKKLSVSVNRPPCQFYKHKSGDNGQLFWLKEDESVGKSVDWERVYGTAMEIAERSLAKRSEERFHAKEINSLEKFNEILGSPRSCPHCGGKDITRNNLSKTCFCSGCLYVWSMK
jgi:hypothetical protein